MNNKKRSESAAKADFLKKLFQADDSVNGASLLPIRLTLIYLAFSVAVYIFGPIAWTTQKPVLFYSLLLVYAAALWLGYRMGVKKKFSRSIEWKTDHIDKILPLLSILIILNYLVYVVNIFRDYGLKTFDFPELFRQMSIGIGNPGLGYSLRYVRVNTLSASEIMGGRLFTLFNYVWSFVRYPILLMGMLSFRKLKIWGKLFLSLYLITMFLFYLSIGTTIDILHLFLLIELPAIINAFSSWYKREMNVKQIFKLIVSLLVGVLLVLSYFTWMMVSRGGINRYDQPDYNVAGVQLEENMVQSEPVETTPAVTSPAETTPAVTSPAETSPAVTSPVETSPAVTSPSTAPSEPSGFQVPPILKKFWISFSSYFTQGYYGMAQAMTLPWTPMYGLGSSSFVVNFVSEHVYDIDQFTYQMKTEKAYGWNSDIQWNCMYTWLANDFSFYGVAIPMLLIGFLFGAMFKDAIATQNPFAKLSVFYFMLMMLFIPCNNQIAQRSDTLFSFALIVFCWLVSKYPPKFLKRSGK